MGSLLIFGGSGFLGQQIIQQGIKQGHHFISVSRSGNQHVASQLKFHPQVTWVEEDILLHNQWEQYLPHIHGVINLIGLLKENPNKKRTYDTYITHPNHVIVQALKKYPSIPYVFLSAYGTGPFISQQYLLNKRHAELEIKQELNHYTILRPGMITGRQRPSSIFLGVLIKLLAFVPTKNNRFKEVYPISIHKVTELCLEYVEKKGHYILNLIPKNYQN